MNKHIYFYNEGVLYRLVEKEKIRSWILATIQEEKKQADNISYIFCSDEYLLKINQEYLNADYLTDVITFDFTEENRMSGDIFISIDRVKENAKLFKQKRFQEMLRVILHGVLHLCGYKDKTKDEEELMRGKEDYYLRKFKSIT